MRTRVAQVLLGAFAALVTLRPLGAERPATNPNAATPEQVLNHHLVRSAQLGPGEADAVRLMPWRSKDDVVEGWDWSLPAGVAAAPNSGLIFSRREQRRFPGNRLLDAGVFWRDVEPEEGRFEFGPIKAKLEHPPEGAAGYRFHFYATVAHKMTKGGRKQPVAPDWLGACGIPVIDMTSMESRFQLFNYPIWDERYHRRYLRVIEALGRSGIGRIEHLRIVYVGAISKSWGDEMYIPRDVATWCEKHTGLAPERLERCLKERLDAWARAFRGAEHKLAWVGAGPGGVGKSEYRDVGARVIRHAYELGMGQRCGFVENYLYHLDNPHLGQRAGDDGYLLVDETCPPIAEGRAFGDENEEYGRNWTGRFGPLETHAYRYHESMLRALQMRRNYLWLSSASVDTDPALTAYVSLALGRTVADSPDAFCYLRQSTVRASAAGKKGKTFAVRNFERWLIQRDRDGYRTKPAIKAAQHEMMWMVPEGHKFDWIARRTDLAGGNGRIGFALDDRFLRGGPHRVAVKVTYHDIGRGRWHLVYGRPGGEEGRRSVACRDSGKVFTATFHLRDACFPGAAEAFDFTIEAEGEDATVSFVRVIKAAPKTAISPTRGGSPDPPRTR